MATGVATSRHCVVPSRCGRRLRSHPRRLELRRLACRFNHGTFASGASCNSEEQPSPPALDLFTPPFQPCVSACACRLAARWAYWPATDAHAPRHACPDCAGKGLAAGWRSSRWAAALARAPGAIRWLSGLGVLCGTPVPLAGPARGFPLCPRRACWRFSPDWRPFSAAFRPGLHQSGPSTLTGTPALPSDDFNSHQRWRLYVFACGNRFFPLAFLPPSNLGDK